MFFFDAPNLIITLKSSRIVQYFVDLYETPVPSEHSMGNFLFFRTAFLIAVSYSYLGTITFCALLMFSAVYDSMTGKYQHTLMNFCHRTIFQNRILRSAENLFRRLILDAVRAEGMTLIALGFSAMTFTEQSHIIVNRVSSGTYYFNAALLDKLVEAGVLCRDFRSRFIIFASTVGGFFSTLHLAGTQIPSWISDHVTPLQMLIGFNAIVFLGMATVYIKHTTKKAEKLPAKVTA